MKTRDSARPAPGASRRDFLGLSGQLLLGGAALTLSPLSLAANTIEALKFQSLDPADNAWEAAGAERQLAALRAGQQEAWFGFFRESTIESLYRNPVVWRLVGYEGSSIEYGGYLERGFDDIDWLDS